MKWNNKKHERFSTRLNGYKGRKNGLSFEISDYTEGWSKDHKGWYVLVCDVKTDNRFNSLWIGLWWKELEEAQKWCESYTVDQLTEYWRLRELEKR